MLFHIIFIWLNSLHLECKGHEAPKIKHFSFCVISDVGPVLSSYHTCSCLEKRKEWSAAQNKLSCTFPLFFLSPSLSHRELPSCPIPQCWFSCPGKNNYHFCLNVPILILATTQVFMMTKTIEKFFLRSLIMIYLYTSNLKPR